MILDVDYITSAGGRAVNQDSVGFAESNGIWCLAVADGVGGYNYGEYASQLALQYIKESFLLEPKVEESALRKHMETTVRRISDTIIKNPSLNVMRTTLSVLYLDSRKIVGGHIGDSRIYIFVDGKVFYFSRDHSLVMQMALRGELRMDEIRCHPKRHMITSAIGKDAPQKLDIVSFEMRLAPADGIILCSDGFWELIAEEEMLELLIKSSTAGQWLRGMGQRVGNRQSNHSDNYTCLAARLKT